MILLLACLNIIVQFQFVINTFFTKWLKRVGFRELSSLLWFRPLIAIQ